MEVEPRHSSAASGCLNCWAKCSVPECAAVELTVLCVFKASRELSSTKASAWRGQAHTG